MRQRRRLRLERIGGPSLLFACSALGQGPFLFIDELVDARGITLEAQPPEPALILEEKDPNRPKLWFAPVATEPVPGGARVWYQRVNTGETSFSDQRVLCVGEIRDGTWKRLPLHPSPPAWSGINNICLRRSPHKPTWGGFNVFQLLRLPGEYCLLYWDQPDEKGKAGAMLARSRDGLRWTKELGTVFTEYNDAFSLLAKGNEYLLFQTALEDWPDKPYPDNLDKKRRTITLRRSKDLRVWTPQETLLRPDREDRLETEFYLLKVFPYGKGYAGLLMKYLADPKLPGRHSAIVPTELIVSRDCVNWLRPFRGTDLGFWSYADPVQIGDKLHFVTWDNGAMRTVACDSHRLVGACAGTEPGEFRTLPFACSGGAIFVNADVKNGWIEARLFDPARKGGPPAGVARLQKVSGTSLHLDFRGAKLSHAQIHFRLREGKVFGLRVSPGE